jgi:hypothetical protein
MSRRANLSFPVRVRLLRFVTAFANTARQARAPRESRPATDYMGTRPAPRKPPSRPRAIACAAFSSPLLPRLRAGLSHILLSCLLPRLRAPSLELRRPNCCVGPPKPWRRWRRWTRSGRRGGKNRPPGPRSTDSQLRPSAHSVVTTIARLPRRRRWAFPKSITYSVPETPPKPPEPPRMVAHCQARSRARLPCPCGDSEAGINSPNKRLKTPARRAVNFFSRRANPLAPLPELD